MNVRGALGDDDLDVSDPYSDWAAQIKSLGGAVTVLPGDLVAVDASSSTSIFTSMVNAQPLAAAKYSAAQAQKLGLVSPDYTGPDGSEYFVAPDNVQAFIADNGIQISGLAQSAPAVAKGDLSLTPQWFKDLSQTAKVLSVVAVSAGVIYGFSVLSSFSRAHPNPPRRRRRRSA